MQKNPTLRPDQTSPKLSDLLKRRGQTLQAYMKELHLVSDEQLAMNCVSQGVDKDMTHVKPKPPAPKVAVPAKPVEKKVEAVAAPVKNALVDLSKAEPSGGK